MTNGKKAKKNVSKVTRTVRRSTYRELKKRVKELANEIDSQLSGELILTPQGQEIKKRIRLLQELVGEQEKGKEAESNPGLIEELNQIKDDLDTLRTQLKSEQIAHANTATTKDEIEQKLKEVEKNQRKSETELISEKEKVARLEAELATARAEQNARPTAQALQQIERERDAVRNEKNQIQQTLDEFRNELNEMDELLANKNTRIASLVEERDSRPTQQQLEQIQKRLDKIKSKAKKWKDKYNNSELAEKYEKLLEESLGLTENNDKLREEHEKELERLKNQQNTPSADLEEKQKEINLLQKTSETLKRENQILQEIITSLKTDNPQEQMEKKQQLIEVLEEKLVDCCSECLVEKEGQEEGLNEAKKEIFQLCKRLEITLPEWLEKKIESAATYKQLIKNLSDIHDRKAIVEIQSQSEKTGQVPGESFTSVEPRKEINPGVKQFFWITGIMALISSILAIIKKWRSSKLRKK